MTNEIAALLTKAFRSLAAAKKLFADGDFDFSVSRAYYAMFYAAEAALLNRSKTYSKHSAIINGFYHEFVATGILPRQYHENFHHAFDDRNLSDYGFMESFPEEDAKTLLKNAETFVGVVRKLIES